MSVTKERIYLKDYLAPAYTVETIDLRIDVSSTATVVQSRMICRRTIAEKIPFVLHGEELELLSLQVDGQNLEENEYIFADGQLTLPAPKEETFCVELSTRINPKENTALEGLYLSSGNYCTQCEAEGFRRITCFPDRPDVMAVFTTTLIADKEECPILLANGNLIEQGDLEEGRHFATFHDPYKKPSYLFAVVAGQLVCLADSFTTASGREVALQIYVEERNRNKCAHAMASLKKAMRWDEEVYGREYDLDTYVIVAVDDFNMGAMENKGLNIFNSKYVLALPESATDIDFDGIEGVIAHEYFHNWTGNRVTCRDWFQLSLKEGLTVFRDQEFSADMGSRAVKRIKDANLIRSYQFAEDAGPMAHPVRPASFVEINNFYTLTVYNKGAEVIRMLYTLLGPSTFRQGMDLYFERHDGQAVTCDDFVQAMADAAQGSTRPDVQPPSDRLPFNFTRFKHWYSQAGTPTVTVESSWDAEAQTYTLHLRQSCPSTPEAKESEKHPFVIPLNIGLLDGQGKELDNIPQTVILKQAEQDIIFTDITCQEKPVLSLLRNFSAPVKIVQEQSAEELSMLMQHDSDPFNRWDAGQRLAMDCLLPQIEQHQEQTVSDNASETVLSPQLQAGMAALLADQDSDPAFLAMALGLPSENWLSQQIKPVDPVAVFTVRSQVKSLLQRACHEALLERYHALSTTEPYTFTAAEAGRRALRNRCLNYLLSPDSSGYVSADLLDLAETQYRESDNMTDTMAALAAVVGADEERGEKLLGQFYDTWRDDPLVVDKWLALQAACPLPGTLERVKKLFEHPAFTLANPNKVRALISTFCAGNHAQFHAVDGAGYAFLTEIVLQVDTNNPQIASRLVTPLTHWRRYDALRQKLIQQQLHTIFRADSLSNDVREVVTNSLR